MQASVIICTHNPRPDYLRRVLDALKTQTLPKEQWELLLIDNASKEPLAKVWDLSWHPHARHIREDELGLTPARLRGIKESTGELLVFVDDDNVLAQDYLKIAAEINLTRPYIGAFGGQIVGDFEEAPPVWLQPHLHFLVIRSVERDMWSNLFDSAKTIPVGAGLCVRSSIAHEYAKVIASDPFRAGLDRKGINLISGGDIDLALTACDMGLGTGLFAELRLSHLIPTNRMKETYIENLVENIVYSGLLVDYIRGGVKYKDLTVRQKKIRFFKALLQKGMHRRLSLASLRGEIKARNEIQNS
jgi:glycosyltransferase involved in cell wall biosynthesis